MGRKEQPVTAESAAMVDQAAPAEEAVTVEKAAAAAKR
jgi:hypothetical protein